MPDYEIRFDAEAEMLRVHSRGTIALDILRPELQGEHIPPGRAAAGAGYPLLLSALSYPL